MVLFGQVLFFGNAKMMARIDGKKAAATKTKADVMIWRLCGLWVTFAGGACLLATDYVHATIGKSSTTVVNYIDWQWPLACLAVAIHTTEIGVKYHALGHSFKQFFDGAKGNMAMVTVLIVGLMVSGSSR